MSELYRCLGLLEMEWKTKKDFGFAFASSGTEKEGPKSPKTKTTKPNTTKKNDGNGIWISTRSGNQKLIEGYDYTKAAGIYLAECRIRLGEVAVSLHNPSLLSIVHTFADFDIPSILRSELTFNSTPLLTLALTLNQSLAGIAT